MALTTCVQTNLGGGDWDQVPDDGLYPCLEGDFHPDDGFDPDDGLDPEDPEWPQPHGPFTAARACAKAFAVAVATAVATAVALDDAVPPAHIQIEGNRQGCI